MSARCHGSFGRSFLAGSAGLGVVGSSACREMKDSPRTKIRGNIERTVEDLFQVMDPSTALAKPRRVEPIFNRLNRRENEPIKNRLYTFRF